MEVKVTLQYSNPHIIRQLLLPETFTLGQLYRAVCISVGLENNVRACSFYKEGVSVKDSVRITEELQQDGKMLFCVVGKEERPDWCWRIEKVAKEKSEQASDITCPVLTRFCGGTIPKGVSTVFEMNRYKNNWYGISSDPITTANLNLKLELAFSSEYGFAYAQCPSCVDRLMEMTVEDMKFIEQILGMHHPSNITKKQRAQLIADDYMENQQVMERILEEMSFLEYRRLCEMYHSAKPVSVEEQQDYDEYKTLYYYDLVLVQNYQGMQMSLELAKGFRAFDNEAADRKLQKAYAAKTAVKAAVVLYGYVDYEQYCILLENCYPGLLQGEEPKTEWIKLAGKFRDPEEIWQWSAKEKIFYNSATDTPQSARKRELQRTSRNLAFYLPDQKQLESIETHGLSLPQEELKAFIELLKSKYRYISSYLIDIAHEAIEKYMTGQQLTKVVDEIERRLGSYRGAAERKKEVYAALQRVVSGIRATKYYGYTEEEYVKLTGGNVK